MGQASACLFLYCLYEIVLGVYFKPRNFGLPFCLPSSKQSMCVFEVCGGLLLSDLAERMSQVFNNLLRCEFSLSF